MDKVNGISAAVEALSVTPYTSELRSEWDAFVRLSRCATFLFERGFMDYHSDRFRDFSLVVRKHGRIMALLPANTDGDRVYSHQGLTYGGWILPARHFDADDMLQIMRLTVELYRKAGIKELIYKPLPYIYASMPSQEDLYALWRMNAEIVQRDLSVTINLKHNPGFNSQQKRNLKRALQAGAGVRQLKDDEVGVFYAMLCENLSTRHDASPVHTLDELRLLMGRFPDKMRLVGAFDAGGRLGAATLLFDCAPAVHAQYICSSEEGRAFGLPAMLFECVIAESASMGYDFFDFGICNEDSGRYLNSGLARQKYGLGGSAVAYDRYRLTL